MLAILLVAFVAGASALSSEERLKLVIEEIQTNVTLRPLWMAHLKQFGFFDRASHSQGLPTFHCHTNYVHGLKPTVAHGIRPGDVNVVAAMGDSLTAGNGISASSIIGDLTEYRGKSWSIGGDETLDSVITLPNILRKYNPHLTGYSLGTGSVDSANAHLNVAHPGDTSYNMVSQAHELILRLKSDPTVDYHNDWKVITLFIGGNDMCDYCHDTTHWSSAKYIANVKAALDVLHDEVPKAFVNLAEIFDITPVAALSDGFLCGLIHLWVCECGHNPQHTDALKEIAKQYQLETEKLVATGRYDTRDDFTVVLQPFYKHTTPPSKPDGTPDFDFFSPDCFHFSEKGHEAAGLALWNNMLQTVGKKETEWKVDSSFSCPGEKTTSVHQFFTTSKNGEGV